MVTECNDKHSSTVTALLSNMYGEHEHYQHIDREAHAYRHSRVMDMLASGQALNVISDCGHGILLGCWDHPWYDPAPIGIERILYVHPDHRSIRLAVSLINGWVSLGQAQGITEFHAGSLIGYRTRALIRLYNHCGFTQQGLTLIKKV